MPCFALFEFLSPVFSLLGIVVTIVLFVAGEIPIAYVAAFLLISLGLGVLITAAALAIEQYAFHRYRRRRDMWRLLGYGVLENVGFHQLHHLWRAIGYVDIARGTTGWGAQQRRGFDAPPGPEVVLPPDDP